jgi:membrane-associated phospholipid phosphatase
MNQAHMPPPEKQEAWTLARGLRQAVVVAVIMFSSLGLYLAVLKWRGWEGKDHVTYVESLDEVFPFNPAWVWVYLIPYLLGPVTVALLSRSTFLWFVRRGLVVVAISLSVFILYPTQTKVREKHDLGEGLTAAMYNNMVAIDEPPANAAPSLHVSLSCMLALALVRDFPRWWPVSIGAALLVWLATLYTRQHHVIDVLTGALVAVGVAFVPWPARRDDKVTR